MADSPTSDASVNTTTQDPSEPFNPMDKEHFTVGVIGKILSHLGSTQDAVIASATCKKWREAWCYHLHTLSFNARDWPLLNELNSTDLQTLITHTIFQNRALHCLTISVGYGHRFMADNVTAWINHANNSLRQLHYYVRTNPDFNFIGIGCKKRLELLYLAYNSIIGVEPNNNDHKFTCLKSLSLCYVKISALDLSNLLSVCPKLETLSLVSPEPAVADDQASVRLRSSSLKNFYGKSFILDKFTLEADLLENIDMQDCRFKFFGFIGKGTLRVLKIDDASIEHFDTADSLENLEIVDLSLFRTMWPELYHMIFRASKLHKLRLWFMDFNGEDQVVNIEKLAVCFPQLKHLSLCYDLNDEVVRYGLQGLSTAMNVVVLELGWTTIYDLDFFLVWVDGILEACLNLEKLVICGRVSYDTTSPVCQILARFSRFLVELGRKYRHIEIDFKYEL